MRNIFLISFVLLFVGCSDDANPITSGCGDGGCKAAGLMRWYGQG